MIILLVSLLFNIIYGINFKDIDKLFFDKEAGVWTRENTEEILKMSECISADYMNIIDNLFIYLYDTKQSFILEAKGLSYFYIHLITGENLCHNLYSTTNHIIINLKDFIKKNEKLKNFNDEEMGYKKSLEHMIDSMNYIIPQCNFITNPQPVIEKNETTYYKHHYISGVKGQSIMINCLQRHRKNGFRELIKNKFKYL